MLDNVCLFLPKANPHAFFNILNLVFEANAKPDAPLVSAATFRMMMVVEGEGILATEKRERKIAVGDVIVMRPARPFAIRNTGDIRYIYVSYLGGRANLIADELKIESDGSLFSGYEQLIPLWLSLLERGKHTTTLACEGAVLYSFSVLGDTRFSEEKSKREDSAGEKIKKYIDDHFSDSSLSLGVIAEALSYSPKYVSAVFSRDFGVGVADYLRTIRVQYACELMEEGMTSIKLLAPLCGYDDPLYFSSVFKKEMNISPREHIKRL